MDDDNDEETKSPEETSKSTLWQTSRHKNDVQLSRLGIVNGFDAANTHQGTNTSKLFS